MPVGPSLCRNRGNDSGNSVAVAGDCTKTVSEIVGSDGVRIGEAFGLVGVVTAEPDMSTNNDHDLLYRNYLVQHNQSSATTQNVCRIPHTHAKRKNSKTKEKVKLFLCTI